MAPLILLIIINILSIFLGIKNNVYEIYTHFRLLTRITYSTDYIK